MKHIVIDARVINSTTGRYVERLLHYLQSIDTHNRYTILVPTRDKQFWIPTNPLFTIQTVDYANYSFGEQIGFKKALDDLHADLVHFCMPQQPILYKGDTVTTFHDLTLLNTYNSDKNWLVFHAKQLVGGFVFKRVAAKSQHIITPSQFTKNELMTLTGVPDDKITVTYESADVATGAIKQFTQPFPRFLLYVGQQSDYKNVRRLAHAHQRLVKKYPDLGLILVGKKNANATTNEAYFASKNYTNIHFTGFVDDGRLGWLYTHAAAYIFPSLMEGFGLPGLEAMCYGAPVVSSNATCLPEVYGDAAHYFDPTNTTDMAKSIDEVLRDETLRTQLIKRGYEQLHKYSWRKMAQETFDVYQKVLKREK